MSRINPLNDSELQPLSKAVEELRVGMGFIPNSVKTMAKVPKIMEGFANLINTIMGPSNVEQELKDLVSYVSSTAAGCRYCQAHTIGSAIKSGSNEEKIKDVWNFENSVHYDKREKAALRFAMASGQAPSQVTEKNIDELKLHFKETEIIELGAVVSIFAFLNRWNDSFATPLENHAAAIAEKHIAHSGWEIGKHDFENK